MVTNCEVEGANKELIKNTPIVIHSLINMSGQGDTKIINLDQIISVKRFSTRLKLLQVTALVLKFKELLRMPENISDRRVTAEDNLWQKGCERRLYNCNPFPMNVKI